MRSVVWLVLLLALGCQPSASEPPPGGSDPLDPVEPGEVPGAGDPSEVLFDFEAIPELWLELSDDAIEALEAEPFEYVEGVFTYDGRTFDPVGVRLKGENSFLGIHQKPAFKIKFDTFVEGGEFLGLEELTLNNMASDTSMMHERMAYLVYREADAPASRAHHARVYLNDEFYGLYVNVETVDRRMIRRWFEDDGGSLFEGWDVDFYDQYVDAFELECGEDDRSAIQGLADALELLDADEALAEAEQYIDLESFIHYWAVSVVVGQFDAYPYHYDDFHMYLDPTSGVLHFIPWGADESFDDTVHLGWIAGLLAVRCSESQTCLEDWAWDVWGTLDVVEGMDWLGEFDDVAAQIEDSVAEDDHKPYFPLQVTTGQASMRAFIETRRDTILEQFGIE